MLTNDELSRIASYSPAEARQAVDAYAASHVGTGAVQALNMGRVFNFRIVDILSQWIPGQLAATYLIPPQFQTMMDRVNGQMAGGGSPDAPQYEDITTWTTLTPPPVKSYFVNNVPVSIKLKSMPIILVSANLPGGETISYPALGAMQATELSTYIQYILPYQPSVQRGLEVQAAAEAIADLIGQYKQDPLTYWQNGRVQFIQTMDSADKPGDPPQYSVGVVRFTADRWIGFTPNLR